MATKSRRQKTNDDGDLASSLKSNFLLKAISGVTNLENYKSLAKRRMGDNLPSSRTRPGIAYQGSTPANPTMSKNQIAKSAAGLGYTANKDGTFKKTPAKKGLGGHSGY